MGEGGPNAAFGLARYETDGKLDPSFGDGGKVTTDFSPRDDYGNSVAIRPDGKIVVGGLSRCCGDSRFAVARYEPDGSLDDSFGGGDGKATIDVTTGVELGFSVAIAPDGKIVVAGVAGLGGTEPYSFGVARFTRVGAHDKTFGNGEAVTTSITGSGDWGQSVAIQPDGKIVVLGHTGGGDTSFGLVRYELDGTRDPTFGSAGIVITNFTPGFDWAQKVVIQPDGRIVAVGGSDWADGGTTGEFAVARYRSDGSLDPTFGGDGKVTANLTSFDDIGLAVALQSDGKIVVAGDSGIGGSHAKLAVARFLAA